jgi:hypothetical protein
MEQEIGYRSFIDPVLQGQVALPRPMSHWLVDRHVHRISSSAQSYNCPSNLVTEDLRLKLEDCFHIIGYKSYKNAYIIETKIVHKT